MPLTIAPPLFAGLGARVLLGYFFASVPLPPAPGAPAPDPASSPAEHILLGAWLGVGLYHSLVSFPEAATFVIGLAIAAALLSDLSAGSILRPLCILVGVALAVLSTDLLAQLIEDDVFGINGPPRAQSKTPKRILQLGSDADADRARMKHAYDVRSARDRERERKRHERAFRAARSLATAPSLDFSSLDISLPSISEVTLTGSAASAAFPSSLEREIAALRARASLADSERRRFREEKKWALSTGNKARAGQMSWQVKRYTALMESFHREADARMIEGTRCAFPSCPQDTHYMRLAAAKARDAAAHANNQGLGLLNGHGPIAESSPPLRQRLRTSKSSANEVYHPPRPKDRFVPMVVPDDSLDISPPRPRARAEDESFDRSFDSRTSRHAPPDEAERSFESLPRSRTGPEDFERSFDASHAESAPLPSGSRRQPLARRSHGNLGAHASGSGGGAGILADLDREPDPRQRMSRHSAEPVDDAEGGGARRRSHTTGALPNGQAQRASKLRASWDEEDMG
jgi:hypothetical protein